MKDRRSIVRQALGIVCAALVLQFSAGAPLVAQEQPISQQPPLQQLTADQLDNLVAPIALYPDSLLSQVLVASTYPLELAEAGQWLQQNRNLQGPQLVDAARQQNWDPSIQALVVFPDVIERLNSNIRWTTDLGNAFLSQQADVMNAVQRLRADARAAGKLNSNTQETIATDTQGGQTVIEIQPANPQVVYVPAYNPEYIWGPPAYGYYPPLYYPEAAFGFGFGPGIYIGSFFGGLGWGGWGWGPNWFGCSIYENGFFFNHYGFRGFEGHGFGDRGTWAHNPEHRLGVAYPNQGVANRFGGSFGARGSFGGTRSTPSMSRNNGSANGNFGNRGNFGASAARGGSQFGGGRFQAPQTQSNARSTPNAGSSQPNRFGSSGSQPNYRSNPTYGGSGAGASAGYRPSPTISSGNSGARMPAYRPSQSFNGGNGGVRSAPAYRPTQPFNGGNGGVRSAPAYRPSPTFSGGNGGARMPAYRPSQSFNGGGNGGVRSAPAYRPSQSFNGGNGGGVRSAPSFGGGRSGSGGSSSSSSSFHASGGGGGGVHASGGGGSHAGGRR
jgi:hypothetical protein